MVNCSLRGGDHQLSKNLRLKVQVMQICLLFL